MKDMTLGESRALPFHQQRKMKYDACLPRLSFSLSLSLSLSLSTPRLVLCANGSSPEIGRERRGEEREVNASDVRESEGRI